MNDFGELRPLKFWCQRVLPLVYDDSLSYYELLCKVVAKINELILSDNELKKTVSNITGTIEETVSKIMNEWLEDGTLKEILGDNIPFMPASDEMSNYKSDTLSCIASYLVVEKDSDCVIGTPSNAPEPVAFHYWDEHGYQGYLATSKASRQNSNFVYNTTQEIDGKNYHVFNTDCSSWLSLILKCRHYLESPYYYGFNNIDKVDDATMLGLCLENGTADTKPYTLDWLNYIITYRAAYMMNNAGNTLRTVSTKKPNENPDIDMGVFGTLETGDIMFFGRSVFNARYRGIHHCAYYIKNLGELNAFGKQYGVEFKALLTDGDDESYGYVVHVSGSTDGLTQAEGGYKNILRVSTLWSFINNLKEDSTWSKVYTAKPYSNAMLSSRAFCMVTGKYPMEYGFFESRRFTVDTKAFFSAGIGTLNLDSVVLDSVYPDGKNVDANTITPGVYSLDKSYHTISNVPDALGITSYLIYICQYNQYRGVQILLDGNSKMWYRVKAGASTWYNWRQVTATEVS